MHNGLSDIKIDGRNDGQEGGNGIDRVCTGIDGGTGHRLADGRATQAGCEQIFEDTVSGPTQTALAWPPRWPFCATATCWLFGDWIGFAARCRIWIEVIGGLEARGVGFRSLTESIDTTTSGGRLIFHVFGALGQFERDLIRDRTKAGLAAAAARGRKGGRKPVVTADKLQRAREHIANGLNIREAAARLKIGKDGPIRRLAGGERSRLLIFREVVF